jgi:cobalt-zinc-cadmium efflux system outer membrane protein
MGKREFWRPDRNAVQKLARTLEVSASPPNFFISRPARPIQLKPHWISALAGSSFMRLRLAFLLCTLFLLSGCVYGVREHADEAVSAIVSHPFDLTPAPYTAQNSQTLEAKKASPAADKVLLPKTDAVTAQYLEGKAYGPHLAGGPVRGQVNALGAIHPAGAVDEPSPKLDLNIPPEVPGSEAGRIRRLPEDKEAKQKAIRELYGELPSLPAEPKPLPGPGGQPLTLADLQQLGAANSAELHQAAYAVEAARGNVLAARAYPNPTISMQYQPSNDGSTAGAIGPGIDQTIVTGGKLRIASAAAEMALRKAELALRKARSDLATRVRTAYYTLLVAQETMRVNRALAHFTDEVYRLQERLVEAAQAAPHEPMALRSQAWTTRYAYQQSIQSYIYAWEQLVAAIGLRHVPLTEVAGRADALIPYFDYDMVRAYMLQNHTDVLTAQVGIDQARYNLKSAQISPVPNVDFNVALLKEVSVPPKKMTPTAVVGIPFPIWDHNKGNIIAAEAALGQALEEPHRVAEALTTNLTTAYLTYKSNLDGMEYYRRHILPDQVRYYWGVYDRRQVDINAPVSDLITAQQTLVTGVTTYLGILGSLWTSAVNVADMLQTDDMFLLARPEALPPLIDLDHLCPWPCSHCAAPHLEGLSVHPGILLPGPILSAPAPMGTEFLPSPRQVDGSKKNVPAPPTWSPR